MPLDEAYFVWLYSQVGSVTIRNRSKTYWKLLRFLHQKEFTWSIEKDENRAQDGKNLRMEFLRESGNVKEPALVIEEAEQSGWLLMGCSMLELMVSLAWKMEFEGDGALAGWFWEMLQNLGLTECSDANPPEEEIVNHILDKVINRDYAANGAGGLFPLKDPQQDQRDVELWYQLNAYLLERI